MATKREVLRLRQRHSISKPLLGSEIVVASLSSSSLPTLPTHHTIISSVSTTAAYHFIGVSTVF